MSASVAGGKPLDRRLLVPELLDALPPDDPRARHSRADLRRINWIMRQAAVADVLIATHFTAPVGRSVRILELGSGDGHALLRLARRLAPRHPGLRLTLLDMAPSVSPGTRAAFDALGVEVEVVTADAFDWLARTDRQFDLALANLFLHHFDDTDLHRLFRALSPRTDLLIATEPLRTRASLAGSRLVRLIGANDVTRHDAPASVRAGFRGDEIGALWSQGCGTVLEEATRFPFTHAFAGKSGQNTAERTSP